MQKKMLYRSHKNKVIGGVCDGFSQYFNVDLFLMRLIWIVLAFAGVGIIAYIAALIIIPYDPENEAFVDDGPDESRVTNKKALGLALIIVGLILFAVQFDFFDYFFTTHIAWKLVWGLLLILVGIILLFRNTGKGEEQQFGTNEFRISRPRHNRMLFGVCAGMAEYFNIDISLMRIFWVIATLAAHGLGVIVYLVLIIVFPSEEDTGERSTVN